MFLKLTLCVLQDIIGKGSVKAKSLQLVVAKIKEGDKTVVIDRENNDGSVQSSSKRNVTNKITDTIFRLSDKNGISTDVSLSIGNNRDPAYKPPDKQGYFTPVRGFLNREFNVSLQLTCTHVQAKTTELNLITTKHYTTPTGSFGQSHRHATTNFCGASLRAREGMSCYNRLVLVKYPR